MFIGRLKHWLAGVLYFNKQERNGIFLLCLILAVLVLLRLCLYYFYNGRLPAEQLIIAPEHAPKEQAETKSLRVPHNLPDRGHHSHKFVFNPNTVSVEDAMLLGFSKKQSAILLNFRKKGGKFFKAEDLQKLYGMTPALFQSLEAYVLIPKQQVAVRSDSLFQKPRTERQHYSRSLLELNAADSLAIVYLKGIGPGYTRRILKYRNLLGGFHAVEQLREIYGMNDSIYSVLASQIHIDKTLLTKIPVNVVDLATLRRHPYLTFQAAQAIVNYRSKHGRLSEADVVSLGIIPAERLSLLLPYLEY